MDLAGWRMPHRKAGVYSRRLRSIARGMLKGASGDRDGCGG